MARGINKLNNLSVRQKKEPGHYGDGGGLWLQVSKTLTKSWVFRYTRRGKTHELGLGPFPAISLAAARDKAEQMRTTLAMGGDPMAERAAAKANAATRMTFAECAERYISDNRAGWKNPKHADQWRNTLETYAFPVIGALDVALVDTQHVLKIIEPIWSTKNETASRLRGRIERVLAWAATRKLRTGDNPARWTHHLDTILPQPSKVKKANHHEALPYQEIAAFLDEVRKQPGIAPRALEFTILTAARTGEIIGATWAEIDLEQGVWTIPAGRMKAGKEHRVPLSVRCLEILREMAELREGDFVFPGWRAETGLSNMAMLSLLKRMGRDDLTVHGFRSSFRDWSGEKTHHPREVIEHALAHKLKDKAEAAYARGTLFDKRRALMDDWDTYTRTKQTDEALAA